MMIADPYECTQAPTPLGFAAVAPLSVMVAPEAVACGFPSPAQDYPHDELDLADRLIRDRASTYIWRASGHSMIGAGISDQDLLIVDRGVDAQPGSIVVAIVDGQFTVKRYVHHLGRPLLRAENPDYPDIVPAEFTEIQIWGVVTWVLHSTLGVGRSAVAGPA